MHQIGFLDSWGIPSTEFCLDWRFFVRKHLNLLAIKNKEDRI